MVLVGEVVHAHPIRVLSHTPVYEAARLMADLGIGDVIVIDESSGGVEGMLTDRDLVVRLVARCLDPVTTTVGDIATHGVTTVSINADVETAVSLMCNGVVQRLPVIDTDGSLAGVVSIMDLAESGHISDQAFRSVLRSLGLARRRKNITG